MDDLDKEIISDWMTADPESRERVLAILRACATLKERKWPASHLDQPRAITQ